MATSLTAGAVRNLRKLEERKTNPTDFTPILQVIKIDEDELKTGKHYTLTLSDGQHYLQAALGILKPSARKLFEQLRENSIIRAKRFVKIGGKGLEVSIILLKFDVITSNSPRIGNPIDICDVFLGDDDPEVLFMLADEYERKGNKYKHLMSLKLAAEAGHATAAGKIGSMYLSCKDKEQRGKAKKYLRLAAEEGDDSIRGKYGFYLANLHRDEGDIENYISALDAAAAASHAEASYVLGAYYLTGKYVEPDREKARFYLNRAANKGHSVAEEVIELRGLKKKNYKLCRIGPLHTHITCARAWY